MMFNVLNVSDSLLLKANLKKLDELLFIAPELYEGMAQENVFKEITSIEGKIYRVAPGRKTLRFTRGVKDYFLKSHSGVGWREILKNLLYLRWPVIGAANEWNGIHHLTSLGIDTMTVSAFGLKGKNPAKQHSFIITEALPTELSLEDFCLSWKDNRPDTLKEYRLRQWIFNKVVHTARTMHESGMNHRDFYLCHFLLDAYFDESLHVSKDSSLFVIDLHRVQLRNKVPERWLIKDLSGLYFSSMEIGLRKRDLLRFMALYSNKPIREVLRTDMAFWNKVERRAFKMYRAHNN